MKKYKGNEIMYSRDNDNIIVVYSQFDMGSKYKIYVKRNEQYKYTYAENSMTKAIEYANKIYV